MAMADRVGVEQQAVVAQQPAPCGCRSETLPPAVLAHFGLPAHWHDLSALQDISSADLRRQYAAQRLEKLFHGLQRLPCVAQSAADRHYASGSQALGDFLTRWVPRQLLDDTFMRPSANGCAGEFSPRAAFDCLFDEIRTRRFMEAIRKEVSDLLAAHPGEEIVVLEAGCGPVPVLSIWAALQSPRVKVYAVESNPDSCALARLICAGHGLDRQISVIAGDASSAAFRVPQRVHLIVSETLYTALMREECVSIMNNLLRQPEAGDARTIPQSVTVLAATAYRHAETTSPPYKSCLLHFGPPERGLGRRMRLGLPYEPAVTWRPGEPLTAVRVPLPVLPLPPGVPDREISTVLYLATSIQLTDGCRLRPGESIITGETCHPIPAECFKRPNHVLVYKPGAFADWTVESIRPAPPATAAYVERPDRKGCGTASG